jgi:hypothetical protein
MNVRLYLLMMVWAVLQSLWPASPSASCWSSCRRWRLFFLGLLLFCLFFLASMFSMLEMQVSWNSFVVSLCTREPEHLGGCSDWIRAGRRRGRSSSPGRVKNFHFYMLFRLALGPTQIPIQWVPVPLSPGVKRQRREANHSPPTSAEAKKTRIYTSTPS